jgi:hypothetical protein
MREIALTDSITTKPYRKSAKTLNDNAKQRIHNAPKQTRGKLGPAQCGPRLIAVTGPAVATKWGSGNLMAAKIERLRAATDEIRPSRCRLDHNSRERDKIKS